MQTESWILFDAGMFIGALLRGDPRHDEARSLVEAARSGDLFVCTTVGILSEVYAALTWVGVQPPQPPEKVAAAIRALVDAPSAIQILPTDVTALSVMLKLAVDNELTARRIHDARHAASAIAADVRQIYTYDISDWAAFAPAGLVVAGPPSIVAAL